MSDRRWSGVDVVHIQRRSAERCRIRSIDGRLGSASATLTLAVAYLEFEGQGHHVPGEKNPMGSCAMMSSGKSSMGRTRLVRATGKRPAAPTVRARCEDPTRSGPRLPPASNQEEVILLRSGTIEQWIRKNAKNEPR